MKTTAGGAESERVLAGASAGGQKLEMLRDPCGWLVITVDGADRAGYRWPAEQLEQCVAVYMAMLRNPPVG